MASSTAVDLATASNKGNMASTALDLLFLTFNCAQKFINVAVFANHIQAAFAQNATGLPDVVVFSLQEVAPMSYAFIGGSFLNPYLARYEQAINLAAVQYGDASAETSRGGRAAGSGRTAQGSKKHYTVVRGHNVGYTGILLFARDPDRLRNVEVAEVGFGAAEMGNKGAVAVRALYGLPDGGESTEMTFVATHLAAMEWNLPRRNANWAAIVRGLAFEDPERVIARFISREPSPSSTVSGGSGLQREDSEQTRLLRDEQSAQLQEQLHDISIFKPSSHLFVGGDLNYRISTVSPTPDSPFPNLDPESDNYYPSFLPLDQLTRERLAGRTLHGLSEHEIHFPPTYKYVIDADAKGDGGDPSWHFAKHRFPSWTDRILYLDVPAWVNQKPGVDTATSAREIKVRAYDALPVTSTSDHRPVFFRANVPLISPSDLAPTPALRESSNGANGATCSDPRLRLPVEVDPEAWGRRAAARRREVMAGWSMFLWSTKQGAMILATVMVIGAGTYWFRQGP